MLAFSPILSWAEPAPDATATKTAKAEADEKPAPKTKTAKPVLTEKEMKPYTEKLANTEASFDMVPIPGGEFLMGSPESEADRKADEGPQRKIKIEPFWMGKYEVTWEEYDIWTFNLDVQRRELEKVKPTKLEAAADAVTRPTRPYMDMTFDMGHKGYPAICMTQLAAKLYCEWLSAKTGHYYRLPTEAEWEYACRAGTTTTYFWGNDTKPIDEYAWYFDNSNFQYQKVGKKKPNPWGLYDIHGNVAEWVLDAYVKDQYAKYPADKTTFSPIAVATAQYPRTVRGGSWDDDPDLLRSAARRASHPDWKVQDPQLPKSVWYHTDALFLGFRLVRPLRVPDTKERKERGYDAIIPEDARILGQGLYDKKRDKPRTGN